MKKIQINKKIFEVVDMDEYTDHQDLYNPKLTAIELKDGSVLPIRNKNDIAPGIYYQQDCFACLVKKPNENEATEYSVNNQNMFDYGNCETIGDIMHNNTLVRNIENEILTTKDNIFNLNIGADDTPEMSAVKEAINTKQIDIKQYESRFDQFQNDLRLLRGKSITLAKMKSVCDKLDIEAELILRDKPECPNPMHKEIKVMITGGEDEE